MSDNNKAKGDPQMPCIGCTVGGEQFRRLAEDVKDIKMALVGDPTMGHRGIVRRLKDLETVQADHARKIFLWTSLAGAAGTTLAFFKEKWLK